MKILMFLILFSPLLAIAQLTEPQVINTTSSQSVKLGPDVEKALKQFESQAQPLENHHFMSAIPGLFVGYDNELPQAVVADFNSDGLNDILLMVLGEEKKSVYIKALLFVSSKKKNSYEVLPLDQWKAELPRGIGVKSALERLENFEIYLSLAEKKETQNTNVPSDRRAFKTEVYLGPTQIYYYKEGRIMKALRRYQNPK